MFFTEFTPIASLVGGALIGVSAVILMFTLGRVMGATGILAGAIFPNSIQDWLWRSVMLLGMLTGPWVFKLITGTLPTVTITASPFMIAVGGLIVGIGVTLGSGCTSGHGVCGLARISLCSVLQQRFMCCVMFWNQHHETVSCLHRRIDIRIGYLPIWNGKSCKSDQFF